MHVAITNPYVWPYVRRGSERLLSDFSRYLHCRGHRVSVHAMAPKDGSEDRDGVAYHLIRQRFGPGPRQFNRCHYFAFRLQRALSVSDADVVFCLNYFDAYAAIMARWRAGKSYKVVFLAVGIPTAPYFRAVPLDAWFMRTVLRESDLLLVLSRFAQDSLKRDFGADALVLPPPVMTSQFAPMEGINTPAGSLRILFVGDVDEPRKGARALCRAFPLVRAQYPEAQLLFAGRASAATQESLLADPALAETASAIRFLGLGKVNDLPALYQSAAVTVLPAVWEAYGLVLVESLAAGTPVVGADHGGIPDVIQGQDVGRLFDPGEFADQTVNAQGLAEAILEVLARGKNAAVSAACQARAESLSWTALGPEYEQVLQRLVEA